MFWPSMIHLPICQSLMLKVCWKLRPLVKYLHTYQIDYWIFKTYVALFFPSNCRIPPLSYLSALENISRGFDISKATVLCKFFHQLFIATIRPTISDFNQLFNFAPAFFFPPIFVSSFLRITTG
jgi:hypothetical protein